MSCPDCCPESTLYESTARLEVLDDCTVIVEVEGEQGPQGPAGPQGPQGPQGPAGSAYYGSFFDSTDQQIAINTPTPMLLNTTDVSNGVTIVSGSRITFANAGLYDLQFSAQIHNRGGGGSGEQVDIWLAKNGAPIADSASRLIVPNNRYLVAAWNFFVTVTAGQWVEFYWQTNNTNIVIEHIPAAPPVPAVPSLIVTANQVA